jgi:uncharacterized protein YbbK (DUF523 family)
MKKILVSECLYGERPVRYDGAETPCVDPVFLRWKAEGRLVPVCPEILGGLTVPRSASQRRDDRVVTENGEDVTAAFTRGAERALRSAAEHGAAFAIMKDGSPSCGVNLIHDGSFTGKKIAGQGVATERLAAAGYRVFSENDIDAAEELLREIENLLL